MEDTLLDIDRKMNEMIKRVDEATQENDHNGARLILAKHLNNTMLIQSYLCVRQLQNLFGHMPYSLMELRRVNLDPKLITELTKWFPDDIDRIKNAL